MLKERLRKRMRALFKEAFELQQDIVKLNKEIGASYALSDEKREEIRRIIREHIAAQEAEEEDFNNCKPCLLPMHCPVTNNGTVGSYACMECLLQPVLRVVGLLNGKEGVVCRDGGQLATRRRSLL